MTVYQSNQPLGSITFNSSLTDNGAGSGGNAIASMLLGYPQQVSRIVSLFYPHYNTKEPFVYVQDDWRATSSLTLNLGLRYDIYTPYTEADNHLVNVDLAASKIFVAGLNGVIDTANIKSDYSNVAPRAGFSATLPGLTVLRGNNVLGGGYLGWKADHLTQFIPNVDLAPVGPCAIQPRRIFSSTLPNVSSIPLISSGYQGTYNAMQIVFQRRQSAGLTLSSNYTLAHAVVTNAAPWDVSVAERYDSDFDVRHRFVFSANYELPFLRGGSGASHAVRAGWQVNGVMSYQSGVPLNIVNGTARTNTSGTDRPNLVGDLAVDNPTVAQWFNVAALAAQPINTAGNLPRNPTHGPPQRRLDLSLFKNVDVTATSRLQLRIEAFNVTNTPSFANPNLNFGTAGFGSITSTGNAIPRQIQLAAKLLF